MASPEHPDTPRDDTPRDDACEEARCYEPQAEPSAAWRSIVGFFVEQKFVVFVLIGFIVFAGLYTAPFSWDIGMPRDRVPVDAIPDIGENQQIVFTKWPGRSPRDVEDQITYPLTTALLGIPGVKTIRSASVFGFSSIYVIFEDKIDFYWSRSRVLEKLSSLPPGTLPDGVQPMLGPDATALGQVYWYTLEGRDPKTGELVGGWDLHELRSVQDWLVRFALQSVPGVSEVASIGGHVREYQVDVDPDALFEHDISLSMVAHTVQRSNLDIGARTVEINGAEYIVRGLGFIESVQDLEDAVIVERNGTPIRIKDVARVHLGPAQRRGALDDGGAEAVGGVVVARYGANPMEVIERLKEQIEKISPGLPERTLADGRVSKITIVPFYDRTELIEETLSTLDTALRQQILVTVVVVLVLLRSLIGSLLISLVLPLGVLGTFALMRAFGVDANLMSLAGIAIAIGTMVDMGIVFVESIVARLREHWDAQDRGGGDGRTNLEVVRDAAAEVAPAVLVSVATTVVSFLPVFGLTASEGKLFRPLAFTKTFAMTVSLVTATMLLPALAHIVVRRVRTPAWLSPRLLGTLRWVWFGAVLTLAVVVLAQDWSPLGGGYSLFWQILVVALTIGGLLGSFAVLQWVYPTVLRWALDHKLLFLSGPLLLTLFGFTIWRGFDNMFGWLPESVRRWGPVSAVAHAVPGLGREDMPPFDEGSYLVMPITMPHASIGTAIDLLKEMDAAIAAIPEVERAVGKLGRAESPLDPAPIGMYETIVTYKPEYKVLPDGRRVRQWRDHIQSPEDIWKEIAKTAKLPGLTGAPMLQPIRTRIVMLQSGMRAPMGVRVMGPDLQTVQDFALQLEKWLRKVPSIDEASVQADRIVGKPYIEIDLNREAIARYGLRIKDVQDVLQIAVGGVTLTRTVEGRERYPVRVRYMREERASPEDLKRLLVPAPGGRQIPLGQLAEVRYVKGPQIIKSEDTFLVAYVTFGSRLDAKGEPIKAEADIVEEAESFLQAKIARGELKVPPGVSYAFAGAYENLLRSEQTLMVLVPLALAVIFLLLYLQFRRFTTTLVLYSGVLVSVAAGFVLMWLYGREGFMAFTVSDIDIRELFGMGTINLSVAVWVGIIALVGVATDNGVVLATYLKDLTDARKPDSVEGIRQLAWEAGMRRVRACLMTTATTILALFPVLTSRGRGSDVMVPMALPSVGGMAGALLTLVLVPVLYAWLEEWRLKRRGGTDGGAPAPAAGDASSGLAAGGEPVAGV